MRTNKIIHLRQLEFYAYHGVLEEEKKLGQKFLVDVDIYPPDSGNDFDDISNTINYADVYQVIRSCVENERYQLIESLADRIASRVLRDFACTKVRVEVHKPQAPVPGIFGDISAEVFWEK